jgi:riboflavin biosynthesis pyrimidine reductase
VPGKSAPAEIGSIYERLEFGPIPQGRPYCLIDMVSTLDGKIVVGTRDEPVDDLGSRNDHALLWRLEAQCDAVLVGAHSLRASPAWHFHTDLRFTVTRSGNLDYTQPFFTEGTPVVAGPSAARAKAPPGIAFIESDSDSVDLLELLATMCTDYGVQYLLVLGGSEMNAPLLRLGVIDEIFLTLAPKIKLGRDVPTLAGGEPLERDQLLRYELAETHSIADEVFLRYRRTKR